MYMSSAVILLDVFGICFTKHISSAQFCFVPSLTLPLSFSLTIVRVPNNPYIRSTKEVKISQRQEGKKTISVWVFPTYSSCFITCFSKLKQSQLSPPPSFCLEIQKERIRITKELPGQVPRLRPKTNQSKSVIRNQRQTLAPRVVRVENLILRDQSGFTVSFNKDPIVSLLEDVHVYRAAG